MIFFPCVLAKASLMISLGTKTFALGYFSRQLRLAHPQKIFSNLSGKQGCADRLLRVPQFGPLIERHMSTTVANNVSKLLLIRHGETTDNVAGLLGGSSDSPLTNHGFQQTTRLGAYLAEQGYKFTNLFSSDLSRAYKTAEAIRLAQPTKESDEESLTPLKVIALKELQEQDFGSFERKPYAARYADSSELRNDPDFREIETTESMVKRVKVFLSQHLMPVLEKSTPESPRVVAVVSHGVLLNTLWRCMLSLQKPKTISLDPEVATTLDLQSLEYLGGWSNTGYLVLEMQRLPMSRSPECSDNEASRSPELLTSSEPGLSSAIVAAAEEKGPKSAVPTPSNFTMLVKAVNCKEHLRGLKRTGGGVGSSKHDEGQKTIEGFFKRQKLS